MGLDCVRARREQDLVKTQGHRERVAEVSEFGRWLRKGRSGKTPTPASGGREQSQSEALRQKELGEFNKEQETYRKSDQHVKEKR